MKIVCPVFIVLQVDSVFETYDQFFNLSPELKAMYAKTDIISPNGWDALERERLLTCVILKIG